MANRIRGGCLAIVMMLVFVGGLGAQVVRPFTSRFSTNDTGDIFLIGNTVLTCPASNANCSASRLGTGSVLNDNDFNMAYVDVDGDASTFDSSRAVLSLPTGFQVLWAGLYWGGDSTAGSGGANAPNAAIRNTVRFATPASGYTTITAAQLSSITTGDYHAVADVTALVQAGGNGTYTVGNLQIATGADKNGGWGLVVVFRAPSYPPRNLTVFDGFATIDSSNPNLTITVSGFTTPPSGPVRTTLGAIAYEGDLGSTGDSFRLNSTVLSNSLNPATNFFNSTVTDLGVRVSAKEPDYVNQLGFDIDRIDVTGILANGATSANISFTTGGETYFPGVLTFSTELFAPNVTAAKSGTDLNGGSVSPGDVLQYSVVLNNTGLDTANSLVLRDVIPAGSVYVPGSLVVTAGPNAGAKTDAAGDDQAELDTVNNRVVFRLGTGATAAAGGSLAPGASTSITFRAQVLPTAQDGTLITNQATVAYNAATLGTALATTSSVASAAVVGSPSVASTKGWSLAVDGDGNGIPSPGDTLLYTVNMADSATASALGVVFTDSPDANTTLVAGSVTTTQGTVTQGDTAGDRAVRVALGTIPVGSGATVTFRVTINNPLPPGVTVVANQGQVSGTNFPAALTDDSTTAAAQDATVTAVTASPLVAVSKTAALAIDADGNGIPSPGDTLQYQIGVRNSGNQTATGVLVSDHPDQHTTLVAGSVTTTQGSVTQGNGAGATAVAVALGSLAGGGATATVTFRVIVENPIATGVTEVRNQAVVNGGNFPAVLSNDPATPQEDDATATQVTAAPALDAAKTASLAVDADGNGVPSPGDTLLYQVTIRNSGNTAATGITLNDMPDANTTLVPGSVQTSQGTVTAGNAPGATFLAVSLGALNGSGGSATVTFRVTLNSPLPAGVSEIANQGQVRSNELPAVPTDDPSTPATGDATVTAVTARPVLSASKVVVLFTDADGNQVPSPGDTLQYQITVRNTGNSAATGVTFADSLHPQLALVVGSVATSQGTVTSGNGGGDTSVAVALGTLAGGGQAVLSFRVAIANPLPAGVTRVANQGRVASNQLPVVLTDDPETPEVDDPTVTGVTSAPILTAAKTAFLFADNDGDGFPSPGDVLQYQVQIGNGGNGGATGIVFTDDPDASTTLVVGSVQTSQGSVTVGNLPGDLMVRVAVGDLAGGASATLTFRVTLNSPLPAGISQVANQGQAMSDQLPSLSTDDPTTLAEQDATVTAITAAPRLVATKVAALATDNDGNGQPSPGDVLAYQITVTNTGNSAATGVIVSDIPDVHSPLVVGSVVTSLGTVTRGNGAGDTSVEVTVGTLAGGATAVAGFRVTILNPLPANVSQISNQGVVRSNQLSSVTTDDPATPEEGDPTVTAVTSAPILTSTKTAALVTDGDGNGVPSPGDTLLYQITLQNTGNGGATGLIFSDIPDSEAPLVVGSVQASQGTVALGNVTGDTTVQVSLGALAGGASATVSFQVQIAFPVPAGVTSVVNQGTLGSNQLPVVRTDDPALPGADDPTVTAVIAAPILVTSKLATLLEDVDENGVPSPGDVLLYTLSVANLGNGAATGVVLSDIPDPNAPLIPGSVQASGATIVRGNNPGDASVQVSFGTIPGGTSGNATFRVQIVNPLPPGVSRVSNQALLASNELPIAQSDDPSQPGPDDPTVTPVTAAPILAASKTVTLVNDADGNGAPSPGDTLLYTVSVSNLGNGAATGVVLTDIPDPNSSLVVGSVQAGAATVTRGNNPGDTSVQVSFGTIPGGQGGSATFRVQIVNPLPPGVARVSNQGSLASNELPSVLTDDPTLPGTADPTATTVVAAPILVASKEAALFDDADGDGVPSPGDVLLYTVTIANTGNIAATGVVFRDIPDPNTQLVVGSVQAEAVTIVTGNNPGDTSVQVDIGIIPGGASGSGTFRVRIVNPLPPGVTRVSNRGTLTSTELPAVLTDDPTRPGTTDPTVTTVAAVPVLLASKAVTLFEDADGNGSPSPGDVLLYTVTVANVGNIAATNVVFTDIPDSNTQLIVGSVQAEAVTIVSGNNPGDTSVQVDIGTIPGGVSGSGTFRVRIVNPLPPGVAQVSNQGSLTSAELPAVLTDDPARPGAADPTVTTVVAAPILTTSKAATLFEDADGNGVPSPGDVLLYTVSVANVGNIAATNVVFTDIPDSNTQLIVGSVQAEAVTIVSGNNPGDTSVRVDIGTIPGGASGSGTFRVRILNPLPPGVTRVSNQGTLTSAELPAVLTDDPTRPGTADPTVTTVAAVPVLLASKAVTLFEDADGNGIPSPGDVLLYTVTVANVGNIAATNVVFTDIPGSNTQLIVGSVQAEAVTIVTGNNPGDTSVLVNIGTIPGGVSGSGTFRVRIVSPLPPGVTQVSNQGSLTSAELPAVLTDDPARPGAADPTVTPVTAAPLPFASKTATLVDDADGNGIPSPGDVLLYTIEGANLGNGAATGVVFTDIPDPNTQLVVGSVQTSIGVITSGNNPGDTTVRVEIGIVPGGASGAGSFRVRIVNPLPVGVTQVSNQGVFDGNELPPVLTDDPTRPGTVDPTVTPVTAAPIPFATKTATLVDDADGNGVPSPGDVLLYTIQGGNRGNGALTGVVFTDTPDSNTQLIVGSVQTNLGTIVSGNNPGDTTVRVNLGTVPGGVSGTGSFRVRIFNPLPAGVTRVSNQGTFISNELPPLPTDDPTQVGVTDPTVTVVTAAPLLHATKQATLSIDADRNGVASPGDTLLYSVEILNDGNASATGVMFNDIPGVQTSLVVGSVQTNQGTVLMGNSAGDVQVVVSVGALAPGGRVFLSFQVRIAQPIPATSSSISNQGTVTSNELPPVPTDDPSTPAEDDPTVTGIVAALGGTPVEIPTLGSGALAALALLLVAAGFQALRRRRRES